MKLKLRAIIGALRNVGLTAIFIVLCAVLMLWLSGRFSRKINAESAGTQSRPVPTGATIAEARFVQIPLTESAVGTIEAVHETTIAARILARVVEINLNAGQAVKKGEVLVRLDDSDLKARLEQAQAEADAAKAEHDQAVIDERRLAGLIQSNAISQNEYDKAHTRLKTTEAELARARQAIAEAQDVLAYATIVSPMDGVVVDKKVDVGDTATPGMALVTVYDPRHLQLVASVRESLARRLAVGQEIGVRVEVMDKILTGNVSEIVPDAQTASRTFQVKVVGPWPAGLYTGTFGRIFIPLEQEEILVVPRSAVRRIGQIELVDVVQDQSLQRRAVRTGRLIGQDYEVLSGLQAGEKLIVNDSAEQQAASSPDEGAQP